MDSLLTATFEAHNPAADRHRWYRVRVGRDLFGEWTLCLAYGRTGQAGQQLLFSASSAEPLQTRLRDHLRRRLSAPRRIGCAYRLVALDAVADFDVPGWLPPALLARLVPGDPRPSEHHP
ncbi:MAG: WGR domain-containing protein [Gemmataceae bacterium]